MTDQPENDQADKSVTTMFLAIEQNLKTYLMRYLVRQQDIEDTVQETFIRAYEAQKTRVIHSPRSFLYKVAKNLALSELSRKTNKMMVTIGDLEDLDVLVGNSSMEDELDVGKHMASLAHVIGDLPPKCQSVIVMRKVYGFSHKEIARRMDISVKTVEKHLTKALQRCQGAMVQYRADNFRQIEPGMEKSSASGNEG
ncbi:MAG: RNA polymerase sigma factor [Pseudohongiellaceae bacterium]